MASSAFKNGVFFPQGQQHGLSLALALHVFSLCASSCKRCGSTRPYPSVRVPAVLPGILVAS